MFSTGPLALAVCPCVSCQHFLLPHPPTLACMLPACPLPKLLLMLHRHLHGVSLFPASCSSPCSSCGLTHTSHDLKTPRNSPSHAKYDSQPRHKGHPGPFICTMHSTSAEGVRHHPGNPCSRYFPGGRATSASNLVIRGRLGDGKGS